MNLNWTKTKTQQVQINTKQNKTKTHRHWQTCSMFNVHNVHCSVQFHCHSAVPVPVPQPATRMTRTWQDQTRQDKTRCDCDCDCDCDKEQDPKTAASTNAEACQDDHSRHAMRTIDEHIPDRKSSPTLDRQTPDHTISKAKLSSAQSWGRGWSQQCPDKLKQDKTEW